MGTIEDFEFESSKALYNLAEDLKTPFVRIATQLELLKASNPELKESLVIANSALHLIDSFVISSKIYTNQTALPLQPVSVKAVLYDCNQKMSNFAKLQQTKVDIDIQRGVGLAMANNIALTSAISSLMYSFLLNNQNENDQNLVLSLKKYKQSIRVGVFSKGIDINSSTINIARKLSGVAGQLAPDFVHGSSAGILLADKILSRMNMTLRAVKERRAVGLAVDLVPSQQLKLL